MLAKRLCSIGVLLVATLLIGCAGPQGPEGPVGPAGPAGPPGPTGPPGENATASQTYVGSERCGGCHEAEYDKFILSGHPHQLTPIENGEPPTFPYDNVTGGIEDPPEGYTWDAITYVIGGYARKAQFIDENGYIVTGGDEATTQYNFANEDLDADAEWVAYHPGEEKPYDCGHCHTTGFSPERHQDGLEGISGSWALPGIQCEECHGPGSLHADDPYGVQMVVERNPQLCGDCHVRDEATRIDAEGGFIRHDVQYESVYSSKHFALDCIACHDPHASTVFADEEMNPDGGIRQTCDSCHWQNVFGNNPRHLGVDCVDCHMPPMAESAVGNPDLYTGDVRAHLFAINTDPDAQQFTEEGAVSAPFITLSYACGHCHNGEYAGVQDLETLAAMADGYHTRPTPTPDFTPTPEPAGAETPTPTTTP